MNCSGERWAGAPWAGSLRDWSRAAAAGGWQNWPMNRPCEACSRTCIRSATWPGRRKASACAYSRELRISHYDLVVRAFPLGVGIAEDPASGAANAAIAAFLEEAGALDTLGDSYIVSQGREMARDAQLLVHLDPDRNVWVGGQCQTVIRGELRW